MAGLYGMRTRVSLSASVLGLSPAGTRCSGWLRIGQFIPLAIANHYAGATPLPIQFIPLARNALCFYWSLSTTVCRAAQACRPGCNQQSGLLIYLLARGSNERRFISG